MNVKVRIQIIVFILSSIVFLSGCLRISADDLYALPEVSEEYLRLQAHINIVLAQGAEFAAPARGPNRQAVQLMDLNGTGSNEVIAFFTVPGESTLKIYIFELIDDDYIIADIIEGIGTDIDSVRYVDMDGDGIMEIIIGWQMGSALKYMSIYSIAGFQNRLLVSGEEYTEITTLSKNDDSGEDVIVLRLPTQEAGGPIAKNFSLMQDGEIVTQEVRLSTGVESISRILTGKLSDSIPAVFVESEGKFDNGSLVTDVLSRRDGDFTNISLHSATGVSDETVRHRMSSSEVNNDGIIKIPQLRRLIAQSETEYFAIDWYMYSSLGERLLSLTTYHNNFDEWYLILPPDWREKVSVRREDAVPGERTIIFSYFATDAEQHEDFLKIFKLSGDNAEQRASSDERVLLMVQGMSAYAFELLAVPDSFGITFNEDMIRNNFRLMNTQWQLGS
ncbi:MAG: VCBS repeat-containing protein [Oscillospiraceae bacterium]|nr:VCBS repeat-containing protein [Oscillospiraceae bacterium]